MEFELEVKYLKFPRKYVYDNNMIITLNLVSSDKTLEKQPTLKISSMRQYYPIFFYHPIVYKI